MLRFKGLTHLDSVACQMICLELERSGLHAEFVACQVDCDDADVWEGVAFRYFRGGQYYLYGFLSSLILIPL